MTHPSICLFVLTSSKCVSLCCTIIALLCCEHASIEEASTWPNLNICLWKHSTCTIVTMWPMSNKTSSTRSKNSAVSSRQARSGKLEASKLACSNAAVQRSASLHCCKPDYLLASPKPYYRCRRHNSSQYSRFHSQRHNMANGYYFPNDDDSDDDQHSYPDGSHFLNLNTSSHKLFYEFMNNNMPGTGNESSQASRNNGRSKQASSSTDSSVEQVYRHHEMALPHSPGGNYGRQNSAPAVAFNDHSRGNLQPFSSSSSSSPSGKSCLENH